MFDEKTWLPAVRRVNRPGMRRNEYDLVIDEAVQYNPATRQTRRNPEETGRLEQAPAGALYRIGVRLPEGSYALIERDENFVRSLRLSPGDPVRVTYYPEDQFATILRPQTLALNGLCESCWLALDGECHCAAAPGVRPNPQLQVLGDWTRRNPYVGPDLDQDHDDRRWNDTGSAVMSPPAPPREVTSATRRFHGKASGDIVEQFESDDGKEQVFDLSYLGHVPAISWLSSEPGSAEKQIDVNGELVSFTGFRRLFRGQSCPVLALHVPTNEAIVVRGTVESLKDRCDSRGVLGFSPVVEYIVNAVRGSSKGRYHYVHEFAKDAEPVLVWNDSMSGLVFDRDRTLVGSRRNKSNAGFRKKAVYEVADWFREKGFEGHH